MLRVLSWLTQHTPKGPIAAAAFSVAAAAGELCAADMSTPLRPYSMVRPQAASQYSGTQSYGQGAYAPYYAPPQRKPMNTFGSQHYNQQQYLQGKSPAAGASALTSNSPYYQYVPNAASQHLQTRSASPYSFAGTPLASAPPATASAATQPSKLARLGTLQSNSPAASPPASVAAATVSATSALNRVAPRAAAVQPRPTPAAMAPAAVPPAQPAAQYAYSGNMPYGYAPPPYFGGVYSPYGPLAGSSFHAFANPPRPRQGSSLNSLVSFDNNLVQMEQLDPPPGEDEEPSAAPGESRTAPPRVISGDTPADQVFGVAPPENDLQFLRAVSVLLEPGERQIDIGFEYAITEGDSVALFTNGNQVAVSEVNAKRRLMIIPLEMRYGLTDNVQLFCGVPFGWANAEVSFLGVDEFTSKVGIGDTNFGASILLCDGGGNAADVVATVAGTAPTGDAEFPLILTTPSSQLGEGFWAAAASILCIKSYDPVVVFYGLGYRHRFDAEFDTFLGPQLVDPGEQFIYQFGAGFAANETVTLSASFFGMYISENYVEEVRVAGGILEPMQLRFAITCAQECKIVEPFAVIGMTDDASSARIGITWTF